MTQHLQRELDELKKNILEMGTVVEQALNKAIFSLIEGNKKLAQRIIHDDELINKIEIKIEENCLKILALYQPVAIDLRFITSVMKINNDLERMGDLAVNIAERVVFLVSEKEYFIPVDFEKMAKQVQKMVRESLDSLVNKDAMLANKVCGQDDIVDSCNREMFVILQQEMKKRPEQLENLIHLLSISRHLERVADLATNIAEDVVYMVEGEIIRHRAEDYTKKKAQD